MTALCVLALLALSDWTSALVVDTIYGRVDGNTVVLDDGQTIYSYWGIPYAAPPVGNLRFSPPQTPQPWSGTFQATELPSQCNQDPLGLLLMTHPGWLDFSEDCLTLNVFTPADRTEAPLAVMVWFHGGAYTGGGNIQYPGHFLAAKGVVVVVPNYRLASFGFLATPDGTVRGNMGLKDQALALRFVRDNIANFGGDPGRVTIFGQSAGAGSSSLHMISPYSFGLYHKGILESGTENNVWSINAPGQVPENYVYQLANKTDCLLPTDPEIVACLRSKAAAIIRINQDVECTPGYFCQGFGPIIDGPGGFIPDNPWKLKQELTPSQTVPLMSGICKDDGSLYTEVFIPEADDGGFNSTQFEYYLKTRLVDIFAEQMTSQEMYDNIYEAINYEYAPYPYIDDLEGNRQAFNELITDAAFGYSWDRNLKVNSENNADTYAFVQAFRGPNATSFIPEWMGVPHMGELPYVWGYAKLLDNPDVRADSGIYFDVVGWTPEDIVYADYQMTLWANFAKYSNPTPTPVQDPFNSTSSTWERFAWGDPADSLKVFFLDTEIYTVPVYKQRQYAFWREYMSYLSDHETTAKSAKSVKSKKRKFNSRTLREATRHYVSKVLSERGIDVSHLKHL